jgi:hypothetical protein
MRANRASYAAEAYGENDANECDIPGGSFAVNERGGDGDGVQQEIACAGDDAEPAARSAEFGWIDHES